MAWSLLGLIQPVQFRHNCGFVEAVVLPECFAEYVVRFRPGAMVDCTERDCFVITGFLAQTALSDMGAFGGGPAAMLLD
jgi:hypothetical protein